MPVTLNGSSSGQITLQATAVAGTNTLTLPAATGTLIVNNGAQTIEFADGSASAPSITNSGDTNNGIYFPAADNIAITTSGVEAMRIDSSGNVGIGTSSPAARLDTVAPDTGGLSLRSRGRSSDNQSYIQFTDNAASVGYAFVGVPSANILAFYTNGYSERMRIDASGNMTLTSPAGLGYGTGSGGTVTQATSKTTTVTLNKPTGLITTNNAALAANTTVSFLFDNTLLSSADTLVLNMSFSGGPNYLVWATWAAGWYINLRNITGGSLSNAVPINFAIIKGAQS